MKKTTIFFCLSLLVSLTVQGQLNPIKNLHWTHTYLNPMNCFNLSWSKPDSSLTDTLLGYKIYRDDSLYIFTTDLYHECDPCIGAPDSIFPFCDFLSYNGGFGFSIHVTALYDHNDIESIYDTIIYDGGYMVGIKNISNKELNVSNIFQNNSSMTIELNQTIDSGLLLISNCLGQETEKIFLQQGQQEITFNSPVSGFYLLSLRTSKGNIVRKIVIK
jgi:hypothetical protein